MEGGGGGVNGEEEKGKEMVNGEEKEEVYTVCIHTHTSVIGNLQVQYNWLAHSKLISLESVL